MTAESVLFGVVRSAAAALLILAPQGEMAQVQHPITLAVEEHGQEVLVRVSGRAERAVSAVFELAVVNGSNLTTHKGRAVLAPNRPILLSTTRIRAENNTWHVTLRVRSEQGDEYTIQEKSPAHGSLREHR